METLGSKTALKLIRVLLDEPLHEFKESELITKAKTGKGSASNCIKKLAKQNFLTEKKTGKTRLYSLNLQSNAFYFTKNLLDTEKVRAFPETKKAATLLFKERAKDKADLLIVFGSTAAGTAKKESDIDILVVSNQPKRIQKPRSEVEGIFGEQLNLHPYTPEQIQEEITDPFIQNILLKGIILHGHDTAKELISNIQKRKTQGRKDIERLLWINSKVHAALWNYHQKDYETAKEAFDRTMEQLLFYLLSEQEIHYSSKADAKEAADKLKEANTIRKINKAPLQEKLELCEKLITDKIQQTVAEEEGYGKG